MHPRFVDILCCPNTGAALALDADERLPDGRVLSGALVSAADGRRYPIVNGVPRFVEQEHYAGSFGYEWQTWSRVQFEAENVGRPMAGHTTRMFDAITGLAPDALRGQLVVEFGCGPGRFLDIVRRRSGVAVGIDMSVAVDAARANFVHDPDVLIVQGDVLRPPFRPASFGMGYTFGVLHHTPAPAEGLRALVRVVKPGGLIACSVYPNEGFYASPAVALFRAGLNAVRQRWGAEAAQTLGRWYAYFAAYFLHELLWLPRRVPVARRLAFYLTTYLLPYLPLPDGRWRVLDVFDGITPAYASTHTADEVRAWFAAAGCTGIRATGWGSTSAVGLAPGKVPEKPFNHQDTKAPRFEI